VPAQELRDTHQAWRVAVVAVAEEAGGDIPVVSAVERDSVSRQLMLLQRKYQPVDSHKVAEAADSHILDLGPEEVADIQCSPVDYWASSDLSMFIGQWAMGNHTGDSIQHIAAEAAGHHTPQYCKPHLGIQTLYARGRIEAGTRPGSDAVDVGFGGRPRRASLKRVSREHSVCC